MEQTRRQKEIEIIELLKSRLNVIATYQDKMNMASWHDHEGVLITGDQAQLIVDCLVEQTDNRVRETGAMPGLQWLIDKLRLLRNKFRKPKYPDLEKYAELEQKFS